MRIGFITAELGATHGWATYSLQLIRALQARGIETAIVASRKSVEPDLPVHPLLPGLSPPERHTLLNCAIQLPRLRRVFLDCDIIHCTVEPFALLGAAIAGSRPLFVTAHGSYVNLPRMRRFPLGALYRRAFERANLICVSHYTERVARELMPNAKTRVINNGVDVASYLLPPLDPGKTAPTVIAVGGVKRRKGTLELIEAMALVRQRIPNAQCLIMGDPQAGSAYTAHLRRRIDALDLHDNVKIMGFVADEVKRAWMAAADVLALPAVNDGLYFEGFGLTLYEAGAAGTAVIGSDGCGVSDAIDDGVTGIIVSQADLREALPRALLKLLGNPTLAAAMGQAGRERARRQSWDSVAQKVIACYRDALPGI